MNKPISYSVYHATATSHRKFKVKLPSVEDLQHETESVTAMVEEFEQGGDPK